MFPGVCGTVVCLTWAGFRTPIVSLSVLSAGEIPHERTKYLQKVSSGGVTQAKPLRVPHACRAATGILIEKREALNVAPADCSVPV
jgi:hypothetical protein